MRALRVIEHPAADFFKDEGGKANGLSTTVRYEETTHDGIVLPLMKQCFVDLVGAHTINFISQTWPCHSFFSSCILLYPPFCYGSH